MAVDANPDDVSLRLHYAELLSEAGRRDDAVRQAAAVLQRDPANSVALGLIGGQPATPAAPVEPTADRSATDSLDPGPGSGNVADADEDTDQILADLDAQLQDVIGPAFTDGEPRHDAFDVEQAGLRLADVGGMEDVKARLEAAVLAPLKNPELVRLYGKQIRGGLLMYGPPGCGKTFIARALAGEIGAQFMSVSLADVLDMYIGQSERNVHELFEIARRNAPCVVFLDEVDALGHKRSQMRNSAARGAVNQLLTEMDGADADNDGVYVLGATNHPWDVDVALRRPGRFDRMILVLPPDQAAREAILRHHLLQRPVENVNLAKLAKLTDGYSGADLAYVCEQASEKALLDSARSGTVRMIGMGDLEQAIAETKPSVGPWLDTARNVAQFANQDGSYDQLLAYLRKRKLA